MTISKNDQNQATKNMTSDAMNRIIPSPFFRMPNTQVCEPSDVTFADTAGRVTDSFALNLSKVGSGGF